MMAFPSFWTIMRLRNHESDFGDDFLLGWTPDNWLQSREKKKEKKES